MSMDYCLPVPCWGEGMVEKQSFLETCVCRVCIQGDGAGVLYCIYIRWDGYLFMAWKGLWE